MFCESFSECGGCQLDLDYQIQFNQKIQAFQTLLNLNTQKIHAYPSISQGFRARGEFRLHRQGCEIFLSMNSYGKNNRIKISSCPILLPILQEKLALLLKYINSLPIIEHKLYGIKILGGLSGEVVITLIYHKKLTLEWQENASILGQKLQCSIIGRSKGEKITIGNDYIYEVLKISDEDYSYIQEEGRFSQPNPYTNIKMIEFVLSNLPSSMQTDLLEMYCGSGNFTIPLSKRFQKVFATEIVKSTIQTLHANAKNNLISNITTARLSGLETIEALKGKREFFRLRGIRLADFNFSHIFLDPPRSGIGDLTILDFVKGFENIIYVSCNPLSLKYDLQTLLQTHKIQNCAVFDQFPYTHHLECICLMRRKEK